MSDPPDKKYTNFKRRGICWAQKYIDSQYIAFIGFLLRKYYWAKKLMQNVTELARHSTR